MNSISKLLTAAAPLALAVATISIGMLPTPALADVTPECNSNDYPDGPDNDPNTLHDNITGTTECGANSAATGNNSTATGQYSNANGANSTATGQNTYATGTNSTATGQNSVAYDRNSTATGQFSTADGANSTATGQNSLAYDRNSTATGQGSWADGTSGSAFGQNARAGSDGGFQVDAAGNLVLDAGGYPIFIVSTFKNDRTTALGANARAGIGARDQNDATAVGYDAEANAGRASAFGAGSRANFANSVALGQGSETDRDNSVSVGKAGEERQITYVADGTQATDAVNKRELDTVAVAAATAQGTADLARTEAAAALLAAQDGTQAASALEPAPMTAALPFPPRSSGGSATMLSSG